METHIWNGFAEIDQRNEYWPVSVVVRSLCVDSVLFRDALHHSVLQRGLQIDESWHYYAPHLKLVWNPILTFPIPVLTLLRPNYFKRDINIHTSLDFFDLFKRFSVIVLVSFIWHDVTWNMRNICDNTRLSSSKHKHIDLKCQTKTTIGEKATSTRVEELLLISCKPANKVSRNSISNINFIRMPVL